MTYRNIKALRNTIIKHLVHMNKHATQLSMQVVSVSAQNTCPTIPNNIFARVFNSMVNAPLYNWEVAGSKPRRRVSQCNLKRSISQELVDPKWKQTFIYGSRAADTRTWTSLGASSNPIWVNFKSTLNWEGYPVCVTHLRR